jgi:hypothetical protein
MFNRHVTGLLTILRIAIVTGILAAPSAANTTYTNLVNAPVAGNSVLILDTTVWGGVTSQEAVETLALGFDVVVNDAATWSTMTTANFATFRAIVLGDPFCQGTPAAVMPAVANRTVWSPVVTGNILITGTDEALHGESSPGAKDMGKNLTRRGIAFATNDPTKTGMYVSLSCYWDGAPVTPQPLVLMDQFGTFMFHGQLGCYNNAHIVATAPGLTGPSVGMPPVPLLLDANLSNWSCSMHEGFDSWPANFSVFAIGKDLTTIYTATDGTKGIPYIIVRGEKVEVVTNIQLGPKTATNPLNTNHTVTATITPAPPPGTIVTFTVVAGPNVGATGTGTTNVGGSASWTYPGVGGPGTDYIVATWTEKGVTYTSNTVQKIWRPCDLPNFSITGPSTACNSGTYCVTPAPPGASYIWSVSNGTIVGPNNGPCVVINWNSPAGGVVTVWVQGGPGCPEVAREFPVKPCDQLPPPCCEGVQLHAAANGWALGPAGSATFTPNLGVLAGMGNITKITATVVSASRTFSKPGCGTPGPIAAYFIGSGFNPNFNSNIPIANGTVMTWNSVSPFGQNLGAPQNFPMTIQFPPPPSWKCADYLSFCIRYEFRDAECNVCQIVQCYGPYKRGGIIIWDTPIDVGVVGIPLKAFTVSLRDPEGNPATDAQGSIRLSILSDTPDVQLAGTTTLPLTNGKATFSDLTVMKKVDRARLRATYEGPEMDPVSGDSNPFNVLLSGQIPIHHITSPIEVDGNITPAEWDGGTIINLNSAVQDILPGNWTGLPDYAGQFKFKWDHDYLYFAAFVRDDTLSLPTPMDGTDPNDVAGRDAMQLFLSLADHQHLLGTPAYENHDFDIRISADPPGAGLPGYSARVYSPQSKDALKSILNVIKFVSLPGGYGIEGALPWHQPDAWDRFHPALGKILGFNLQGRDNDQAVYGTDTLMSLTGLPGAETNPGVWTSAILLGAPTLNGDVNGDGVVDNTDVALATQVAGGTATTGGPIGFGGSDYNGDGKVDMKDAVLISRKIRGL